jgi:nucleotide-binding universal stress UspA family protein
MKVLIAIDGSDGASAAVHEAIARPWPSGTEIEVLTVISTRMPLFPDPAFAIVAARQTLLNEAREHAPKLLESARAAIQDAHRHAHVAVKVAEGSPKTEIVDEAERWGADLILLGAHGWSAVKRAVLGSVSQSVVTHAHCSVEVVRDRTNR